MSESILNRQITVFLRTSRFIKVTAALGLVLTAALAGQAYWLWSAADEAVEDGATIEVLVGEMYFEQAGTDLEANRLEAGVGDVLEFYNEGDQRHSVTVDELDYHEVIAPGERATLELEEAAEELAVTCEFHDNHEATLAVLDEGVDHEHGRDDTDGAEVDTDDLPRRGPDDAVEQLEYELVDGVKEFELSAEHIMWQHSEEQVLESYGFEGQLPGPEIRVTEGDEVRIVFENNLPVSTTVHWHGVDVPNEADGVPHVTQDPVEPGESFVYEFEATPAGTRFYHAHGSHHGDEGEQVDMGLSGPLIIEPEDFAAPDHDYTMLLTERPEAGIYPIEGRVYPDPQIYEVSEGDRVRVRMINAGSSEIHPMHLHGHQFEVVAEDGNPVPQETRQLRNNLPVAPGETYDIEFIADNPGHWVFHCHELNHAAGGMVAEVVYE